jgi:hypothetical protein
MHSSNTAEQEVDNTIHLHLHAMDNISYIRETMSRSTQFTAVPGWGMVIVGVLAMLGSYIATLHLSSSWWFNTWITIGFISMAIVAGMALTDLMYWEGIEHLLPCMWLLIYGLAVLTAGAFSHSIVPFLGLTIFVLGIMTMQPPYLFSPFIGTYTLADICMVTGFGLCHIIYGLIIALRHGG